MFFSLLRVFLLFESLLPLLFSKDMSLLIDMLPLYLFGPGLEDFDDENNDHVQHFDCCA
jgi:hypothetical protein